MSLVDDFFRESERVIAQFDKPIDFFKSIKYPDPQGITSRYRRALKDHRLPTPGTISQFEGFIKNEKRKEERRMARKNKVLDAILRLEGYK